MALNELYYTKELKQKVNKEFYYTLNVYLNVFT
jgi:hypothetical protein